MEEQRLRKIAEDQAKELAQKGMMCKERCKAIFITFIFLEAAAKQFQEAQAEEIAKRLLHFTIEVFHLTIPPV